jgi:ATP-dependent protease ClpP protease subunit
MVLVVLVGLFAAFCGATVKLCPASYTIHQQTGLVFGNRAEAERWCRERNRKSEMAHFAVEEVER